MSKAVQTTCPYCGVGCGVSAAVDAEGRVTVKGDPDHPANFGRLCSKGAALGETVDLDGRLLYPEVNGAQTDWDTALGHVAERFQAVIREHGPEAVAFYVSGQLLTEDYYVANKLMKGFIGSANIDTNSRLCMSSAVAGYKRAFGADTVPCNYEDLERAKLIVLAGSNAAWCHPVLYQRIVKARKEHSDLRVIVIDPRKTNTCDGADLHLAIAPGTDATLFNGLLVYLDAQGEANSLFLNSAVDGVEGALAAARADAPDLDSVARRCGLSVEDIAEFYRLFARTERVVTVYSQGINQFSMGTDKVNSIINCHLYTGRIGRAGMGPFSMTGQPNAMGGREVGGLANQLAAHMDLDNPEHTDRVQRFWNAPVIAQRAGLKAVDMFEAVAAGKIKALWVMATNPAVSLPDSDRVRDALAQCEFLVVSDCVRHTDTTTYAHVLLPASAWGEKDGTVTNSERRILRQRAFLPSAGEAQPDWWIVSEVAKRMGFTAAFDYASAAQVFREHAALSAFENAGQRDFDIGALARLDDAQYAELQPLQWPRPTVGTPGTRLFADGRFFTPNGRARMIAIAGKAPASATDADYPLVLNTGRVRDHWHTLTRTGKSPRLSAHSIEPYAEIHPDDAARYELRDGALLEVTSRWGRAVTRIRVSGAQRPGSVFMPIHWNNQFSSLASVDSLIGPHTDPLSGQPEFKFTPVRVRPYVASWYGFLLSRRSLALRHPDYWACAKGNGFWRYEIAGTELAADWARCARELLCAADERVEWTEYFDQAAHRYRGARLVSGRLESCVFIGQGNELPPRDWLAALFDLEGLEPAQRASLLSGKPPRGETDRGRTVCACFNVGRNTLVEAIRQQGLTSVEAIGAQLQAGTNCGSCVPELRALLTEVN
ncbi:MAG: molybdopterin-dependent oxidoreductase [Gammaproteobacteria bacterium]|nr:molybdopterin-dependent oxidoreductase [Gammaproteobacteria bacterium]